MTHEPRKILERFDSLPDDAIVPSKVTGIVLGLSERTIRYHPHLPRVQISRGRALHQDANRLVCACRRLKRPIDHMTRFFRWLRRLFRSDRQTRPTGQVGIFWFALLLTLRLKLISALIILFAAELCAGCLAAGVINVCLIRRRSRAASDKQACK